MKEKLLFCLLLVVLFFSFVASPDAAEVRISAAASLTDAVKEVVADYRQSHPELKLLPNFASSGALAKQISVGAPTDIYISANPKWMDYLQRQGMIAATSNQLLVRNSLVFVGMPGTIEQLSALPKLQRIAIGSPKSTPVGRYAEQAMTNLGVYPILQQQQKLILTKDVRQALLYADRGEVDGAFVYRTDALLVKRAEILFVVPQELYPQVVYPAALTKAGADNAAAKEFFAFLFSEYAQDLFKKYGFVSP